MKNIKQAVYATAATALAVAPLAVGAASPVSSGFNTSVTAGQAKTLSNEPIFQIVSVWMNWLLGIVGVLAVLAFVISGILYLTAAGNEEQVEKAKSIMTSAIVGLVVALLGLIIVNAVTGLMGASGGSSF